MLPLTLALLAACPLTVADDPLRNQMLVLQGVTVVLHVDGTDWKLDCSDEKNVRLSRPGLPEALTLQPVDAGVRASWPRFVKAALPADAESAAVTVERRRGLNSWLAGLVSARTLQFEPEAGELDAELDELARQLRARVRSEYEARMLATRPFVVKNARRIGEVAAGDFALEDVFISSGQLCVAQGRGGAQVRCYDAKASRWGKVEARARRPVGTSPITPGPQSKPYTLVGEGLQQGKSWWSFAMLGFDLATLPETVVQQAKANALALETESTNLGCEFVHSRLGSADDERCYAIAHELGAAHETGFDTPAALFIEPHFVALAVAVKLPVEKMANNHDDTTFLEGEPAFFALWVFDR